MNPEYMRRTVEKSYELIEAKPKDRLDYLDKALKLRMVLSGGIAFITELAMSIYVDEFTVEDLAFIHESFCVSAIPLVHMIEHFLEKAELEGNENPFIV